MLSETEKILIISPQAGFGNRIRAICSGIVTAEETSRKPYLIWPTEEQDPTLFTKDFMQMKHQNWESYFQLSIPIANFEFECNCILSEWLPTNEMWYPKQSSSQLQFLKKNSKIPILKLTDNEHYVYLNIPSILIETSKRIIPNKNLNDIFDKKMSQIYQKYFIPQQKYIDYMNNIPEYNIGISIRRGNFELYYSDKCTTKLQIINWILLLLTKIIKEQNKKIIIFSDDYKFRDEIICHLILKFKVNPEYLPRIIDPNLKKWEIAFIEFLTLSWKCQTIYGTKYSSFAEEAGIFGGKFHYNAIEI